MVVAANRIYLDARPDLLTTRQFDATRLLASDARHVNLVGGSRSGKTTSIVRAMVIRALKVKTRHVILRFHATAVWPSIGMQTLPFVMRTFFPNLYYKTHISDRYFSFYNSSEIWLGGLDEKERVEKILGNEYVTMFFNECSEIPYQSVLVALSRLAERVSGMRQRAYYDLNPLGYTHWTNTLFGEHRNPITKRSLEDPENYVRMFLNPHDHAQFLDPEYLKSLDGLPPRVRARFRDGVYVDESASQLWSLTLLEETRIPREDLPPLQRIIVAVDPSGAKSETDMGHDPIGIVTVGRGFNGHAYVLADDTMLGGPLEWARMAIAAYHAHKADRIVAEINFGGAMVEATIRTVDSSVPFTPVTASRGKVVRAEPASALYHQKLVHHVGSSTQFAELEDELLDFTDSGYNGEHSPNRADALVWALTELMLGENATGWVGYYKSRHESIQLRQVQQAMVAPGMRAVAVEQHEVELVAQPHQQFYTSANDGAGMRYVADAQGRIFAQPRHVAPLLKAGCVYAAAEVTQEAVGINSDL